MYLKLAGAILFASCVGAHAEIVELRLGPPEPFAEDKSFGSTGAYVRLKGVAKGELDPKDLRNKVIADLDKAPLNRRGRVEYETDVFILRPADLTKGSQVLLYEVTNRGRKFFLHWLGEAKATSPAAVNDPKSAADAGSGFGLDRGYTLVWSGWDPDAPKVNSGMTIRVPVATEGGAAIVARIRHEFQVATRGPGDGTSIELPYPAAATDTTKARLTVRAAEADARTEIAADKWEFAGPGSIRLKDSAKFERVKIHELWYDAKDPKVLGIGYAATRDLISFLRHASPEKIGEAKTSRRMKTLAIGISQSGRYLRHYLELGMNADEKGRRVFDGVLAHISGAGKVFANHRFGQPNRTATQHEDRFYPENWFPFGYRNARDPLSDRTGALTARRASDPKIIEVNTSTEYWQKGASLVHTDPTGRADASLPPNVRAFLIAGTQHGGRAGLDDKPGLCAMPRNPHNPMPALRALLVALEDWVRVNRAPPASRVPEISRRTAVEATVVRMPKVGGLMQPTGATLIGTPVDWVNPPVKVQKSYGVRVPAVNEDGNETAGVRLPPIAVPLGTYTGWNLYKAAPSDLCDRDGSFHAFAKTKTERDAKGDARPSLAERYKSKADYLAKVKATVNRLVADRLLLPVDGRAYLDTVAKVEF